MYRQRFMHKVVALRIVHEAINLYGIDNDKAHARIAEAYDYARRHIPGSTLHDWILELCAQRLLSSEDKAGFMRLMAGAPDYPSRRPTSSSVLRYLEICAQDGHGDAAVAMLEEVKVKQLSELLESLSSAVRQRIIQALARRLLLEEV